MNFKILISIVFFLLISACQSTTKIDKSTEVASATSAFSGIAVTRPQAFNDFPVSYTASSTDSHLRVKVMNRLELVESQPELKPESKGWFDKFKNILGF